MSSLSDSQLERLVTLLADGAVEPLSDAEQRELDALLAEQDELDVESFDRAAAAITLAVAAGRPEEALPGSLRTALERGAQPFRTPAGGDSPTSLTGASEVADGDALAPVHAAPGSSGRFAWFAAAAAVVVAVGVALVGANARERLADELAGLEGRLDEASRQVEALRQRRQAEATEAGRLVTEAERLVADAERRAAEAAALAREQVETLGQSLEESATRVVELEAALGARDEQVATLERREADLVEELDALQAVPPVPSPAAALAALREANPDDLVEVPWATTEDELVAGAEVSGRIVWSKSRQEGYMVFDGMPANDPALRQYQLWIFDRRLPETTPVDGGVFDVADAGAEIVVPIDPKLVVEDAYLFAVTAEPPGGVVVSDRQDLLLLANG